MSEDKRARHLSVQVARVMEWRRCPLPPARIVRAGFAPLSPSWARFIILATATGLFILRALGLFILRPAEAPPVLACWWEPPGSIDRSRCSLSGSCASCGRGGAANAGIGQGWHRTLGIGQGVTQKWDGILQHTMQDQSTGHKFKMRSQHVDLWRLWAKPFDLPSTIRFRFFQSLYLSTHDSTVHLESYVDAFLHLNHFSVWDYKV